METCPRPFIYIIKNIKSINFVSRIRQNSIIGSIFLWKLLNPLLASIFIILSTNNWIRNDLYIYICDHTIYNLVEDYSFYTRIQWSMSLQDLLFTLWLDIIKDTFARKRKFLISHVLLLFLWKEKKSLNYHLSLTKLVTLLQTLFIRFNAS